MRKPPITDPCRISVTIRKNLKKLNLKLYIYTNY